MRNNIKPILNENQNLALIGRKKLAK